MIEFRRDDYQTIGGTYLVTKRLGRLQKAFTHQILIVVRNGSDIGIVECC